VKFNDIGNVFIQSTQVSYKGLGVILPQITFQKELFKLPSVFFCTFSPLFKVVEFKIVVLKVVRREKLIFQLVSHLIPRADLGFSFSKSLGHNISPPNGGILAELKGQKLDLLLIWDIFVIKDPFNRS